MIHPDQEDIRKELVLLHQQWCDYQITKTTARIITEHKQRIIDAMLIAASDTNVNDAKIRYFAVQLQTIETIEKLIYDTDTFITRT